MIISHLEGNTENDRDKKPRKIYKNMKNPDFWNSFEMTVQSVKIILSDFVKNVYKFNFA